MQYRCSNSPCLSEKKKAGQLFDKPDCKLRVCLCGSVCTFDNRQDSQRRGVFLWYGSLPKPSAAAPFSESGVKWLVFYWWAPEVASVGNWIFDLLEFGKYILSVWSSPGKTPPSYQHHYNTHTYTHTHTHTHTDTCTQTDRRLGGIYSSPSPKHIFVLDVFTKSLHGDYRCSLTKLGICFKL